MHELVELSYNKYASMIEMKAIQLGSCGVEKWPDTEIRMRGLDVD